MPSATFYDGVGCIGGTKILLSGEDSHIFLEFGINFQTENQYFDWPTVTPQCLADYLKTGLLPMSHELYDISVPYRWLKSETELDGVLVSHAHLDHYGMIPLFEEGTRVFAGKATKDFIDIRNEARRSVLWKDEVGHLDFRTFTTKDNYVLVSDEIAFNPIHVDHSIPASYGFLIYIGGRKVAYTGDFRMHGRKSNLTEDFLDELRNNDVDVLICEGTNLSDSSEVPNKRGARPRMIDHGCRTEAEVEGEVRKVRRTRRD